MAHLKQLIEPERYDPCDWDLSRDHAAREYWVDVFLRPTEVICSRIRESYPSATEARIERFAEDLAATISDVRERPERYERITILLLDELREQVQRRHGFDDPFRAMKRRDTAIAVGGLAAVLAEVDQHPHSEQTDILIRGLLAGNVYDVGAAAALALLAELDGDFQRTRAALKPRPWPVDGVDAWARRWERRPYRHVGMFVDNAGADICLGILPLARWMLAQGARVTLAANSEPALNDVTAPELRELLGRPEIRRDSTLGDALQSGRMMLVASGGHAPLLDLADLSDACVQAVADADLIMLHGMGRAIESNHRARLSCDATRSVVLKDEGVAGHVGCELFDCIFRFDLGADR